MRPFRPLSWLLLLLVSAAPAAAQRPSAYLLYGGVGARGSLPGGGTPFDVYSRYFEQALLARPGSVRLTNLAGGDLTTTYGVRFRGWDESIASERYRAAAFLATQISSARPGEARRLELAMWNLMGATDAGGAGSIRGAVQEALLGANAVDAAQWTIASDVEVAGRSTNEFLVQTMAVEQAEQSVVPEPEVIILLASGLLALGAVAYFRGMAA